MDSIWEIWVSKSRVWQGGHDGENRKGGREGGREGGRDYLDDLGHGLLQERLGALLEPVAEARVEIVGQVDGDEDSRGRGIAREGGREGGGSE